MKNKLQLVVLLRAPPRNGQCRCTPKPSDQSTTRCVRCEKNVIVCACCAGESPNWTNSLPLRVRAGEQYWRPCVHNSRVLWSCSRRLENTVAKVAASAAADDGRRALPKRSLPNGHAGSLQKDLEDAGVLPDKAKKKGEKAGGGAKDVMTDPRDPRFSYVAGYVIMECLAPPEECTFAEDCECASCHTERNKDTMSGPIPKHSREIKRRKTDLAKPPPAAAAAEEAPKRAVPWVVVEEEVPERLKALSRHLGHMGKPHAPRDPAARPHCAELGFSWGGGSLKG